MSCRDLLVAIDQWLAAWHQQVQEYTPPQVICWSLSISGWQNQFPGWKLKRDGCDLLVAIDQWLADEVISV